MTIIIILFEYLFKPDYCLTTEEKKNEKIKIKKKTGREGNKRSGRRHNEGRRFQKSGPSLSLKAQQAAEGVLAQPGLDRGPQR